MIRPGRLESSTIRSASRAASRTLCVTKSTVSLRSRQIRSSSSCSRSRVIASSAPNGSSMSSTGVSRASVRASATRCRMPPESSCGALAAKSARCTRAQQLGRPAPRRSARGTPRSFSGSSTLASTVSHGNSAGSWNIRPGRRRRPASIVPAAAPVQPGDQVEQRALAAAGRADQADELAGRDVEARRRPGPARRSPRARTPWSRRRARPPAVALCGVVVVDVIGWIDLRLALRLEHLVETSGRRCP